MQVQKVSGIYADRVFLCFPICIFSLTDGAIATEDMITSKKSRRKTQYSRFKCINKQAKVPIRYIHFFKLSYFFNKELD